MLDVATGKGQFVQDLVDELGSYTEIIGMDVSKAGAADFEERFAGLPSVRFLAADATAMPFPDESFDTVAIAGSLHHLADPGRVLAEMRRVLRSGGAFIVFEQSRDHHQTKAELTHIRFHHWTEEILGIARPTYRKSALLDLVGSLGLVNLQAVGERDETDSRDPSRTARFDAMIGEILERARGRSDLVARGQAIRARLHDVAIAIASALFIVGVKP